MRLNAMHGRRLAVAGLMLGFSALCTAQTAGTWSKVANEGSTFNVSGTQTVRFGASSNWVTRSVSGSVPCTAAYFGDPLPGVAKRCELYATSPGTASLDMLGEWANCKVPTRLQFVRERQGPWWPGPFGVTRTEWYLGGPAEKKAFQNPEGASFHAPGHVQNCTAGSSPSKAIQWATFKIRTTNYFGTSFSDPTAVGDHIAIVMRAKFGPPGFVSGPYGASSYIQTPQYQGRGIILHRSWGVMGEHYSLNQPSGIQTLQSPGRLHPLVLQDGVTYAVSITATDTAVVYQVLDPATGKSILWGSPNSNWFELPNDTFVVGPSSTNARTPGTGFALVPLCNLGPKLSCENTYDERSFTVDVTELAIGWF